MAPENSKKILKGGKKIPEYQEPIYYFEITVREIIIYSIFVVLVSIVSVGMISTTMFYLTRVFQKLFIEMPFSTSNEIEINFEDINNFEHFWAYCESALMDGFYWKTEDIDRDGNKILYQNKLLGVPRLRQVRTKNNSCTVHEYFRNMSLSCYEKYSSGNEDKDSFGLKNGTAWVYQTSQKTKSLSYRGKVALYGSGGFYQDLGVDRNESEHIIANLKTHFWITPGTRCVFVDFAFYNSNINLFCIIKIIFEFPLTGGVIPSHYFNTFKLIRYFDKGDYLIMGCELLIAGFMLYYTFQEIVEINYIRMQYLKDFWNYMDLIILIIAYCCLVLEVIIKEMVDRTIETTMRITTTYANFEYLVMLQNTHNFLFAMFLFVVYIKIFKYLNFSKTMWQLNKAFHRCALDIFGFSIMFLIIITAYAALGYLLFGTRVEGFSSLGSSVFTLFRTILGDFDYSEIEVANKIFAPIFFLSYIFLVFFVLLNMFLAIIHDTYSEVKSEVYLEPDETQEIAYFKNHCFTFLSKVSCINRICKPQQEKSEYDITNEKIREVLIKCGFTNLEIKMFFHRFNIDPTARVGHYDIKQLIQSLEDDSSQLRSARRQKIIDSINASTQHERLYAIERPLNSLTKKVDQLLDTLGIVYEAQAYKLAAKAKKQKK